MLPVHGHERTANAHSFFFYTTHLTNPCGRGDSFTGISSSRAFLKARQAEIWNNNTSENLRVFVNRKHPKILTGNSNISNIEAGEIQSHQTVKP